MRPALFQFAPVSFIARAQERSNPLIDTLKFLEASFRKVALGIGLARQFPERHGTTLAQRLRWKDCEFGMKLVGDPSDKTMPSRKPAGVGMIIA